MTDIQKIKYSTEPSKEGAPTLFIVDDQGKKIYIHSKYNPLKEAASLADKFMPWKFDAIIILGAGLAYHLLPLKDLTEKYNKIIIVEAIKDIKSEIAKNRHTGFIAESDTIKFISGKSIDEVEGILNKEIDLKEIKGLDVIDHPPSVRALSGYYGGIKKIIKQIINKKAGDIATQKAFGMLYLRNIFKNFNALASLYPVSAFFDKMNEYPVLVIASGPSIERYTAKIKEVQNKFFIIAVDSVLNFLFKNDIIPDFFLSIDPQPFIFEHIIGIDNERTIPIFAVSSHPLIIEKYKKYRSLLSLNTHPLSQIIDDISENKIGNIDSGTGTVAGDAIMAAKKIGFYSICLAGFDFSFQNFITYPRGTAYQKRFSYSGSRMNPVETVNFNYIIKSSKGIKFENRFTRKSFIQYKESIERFIKKTGMCNIFNINETGMQIEGTMVPDSKSFIDSYCMHDIDKEGIINKTFSSAKKSGEIISYKNLNKFIKSKGIFEEIINASFEIKPELKKIDKLKFLF